MDEEPAYQGLKAPVEGRCPVLFVFFSATGWNFKEFRGDFLHTSIVRNDGPWRFFRVRTGSGVVCPAPV